MTTVLAIVGMASIIIIGLFGDTMDLVGFLGSYSFLTLLILGVQKSEWQARAEKAEEIADFYRTRVLQDAEDKNGEGD